MTRSSGWMVLGVVCCALLAPAWAYAGQFSVNPVRLELGPAARSGAIAVRNEGKLPINFQLQAMEWAQDADGKDQYLETRDLIFFPKILTVEPGQEGVVRVGTRTPVVPTEKTYRLFIEELPSNVVDLPRTAGPQVSFLIRFGAAIFIAPLKPGDALEIGNLALVQGALTISARNTGNRHQVVQGVQIKGTDASGQEVYGMTLADRYLLAGTTKSFTTSIASTQCHKIAAIEVEIKTDRLSTKRKLEVGRAMCAAK